MHESFKARANWFDAFMTKVKDTLLKLYFRINAHNKKRKILGKPIFL